jgi:hypothetical protein
MTDTKDGTDMVIELKDLDELKVMVKDMPEGIVISIRVEEVMAHAAKERK